MLGFLLGWLFGGALEHKICGYKIPPENLVVCNFCEEETERRNVYIGIGNSDICKNCIKRYANNL